MLIDPVPEGGKPVPQRVEPGTFDRSIPDMKDPD
jgi:NADH-quinone oxidoreductase subunit I